MENHSEDSESPQLLGDWDSPPPRVSDKNRGGSTSTVRGGRVLPPWANPSNEWGGGKWKQDGRKNKKKKQINKDKDTDKEKEKEKESDLRLEDLMNEYSSLPPQIAEWFWCIEYVAKFTNDLSCILDMMNMGFNSTDDFVSRINELISLKILEFLFDPTKNGATVVGPRIEFGFSLSNTHVLCAILKDIPVSELRPGMPELSNFNVLPFIAHKNMSLPQCALEKLRDVCAMKNQTSASPPMEANDPVSRDDRSAHMDVCEEQLHTGLEQTNNVVVLDDEDDPMQTNERDEVIVIDDEDDPMQTNDRPEVIVLDDEDDPMQTNERDEGIVMDDGNDTTAEQPINKGNTTKETFSPSLDARVECTKDGVWLINEREDESDMVEGLASSSIPPRLENLCWKCEKEGGGGGSLLICSRSECAAKFHKECLNCQVHFDEDGNFHCPVCWYDQVTIEYITSQKVVNCAKRGLMKFLHQLCRASKRVR